MLLQSLNFLTVPTYKKGATYAYLLTELCANWLADIEPLQNNPDLEEGYCKALLCRLRFRKVLS